MSANYVTNGDGDIIGRIDGGRTVPFEPESFGWAASGGKTTATERFSLDQIESLPGFSVTITSGPNFVPGPRPARSVTWLSWPDGAAPPAAVESKGGIGGTLAYSDRLTEALGHIAERLPGRPDRSPFLIHDFVGGRILAVAYDPPDPTPGGSGVVYVLDDGDALKVGHTTGHVAKRIAGLQTGNPRIIRALAAVGPADEAVEAHLHAEFGAWARRGEWFERRPILEAVREAGGWPAFLRRHLPEANWDVVEYGSAPAAE